MIPTSGFEVLSGNTIYCDVDSLTGIEGEGGYSVVSHTPSPAFEWDRARVKLYVSPAQVNPGIDGHLLYEELRNKHVLNARALQFLMQLRNQHHVPSEWTSMRVTFWGTVYRSPEGLLCVRSMFRMDCEAHLWDWEYSFLDDMWSEADGALVLAH